VELGYAAACLIVITTLQCIKQAQWPEENPVLALPGIVQKDGSRHGYATMPISQLLALSRDKLDNRLPKEVRIIWVRLTLSLHVFGNPSRRLRSKAHKPHQKLFVCVFNDWIAGIQIGILCMPQSFPNFNRNLGSYSCQIQRANAFWDCRDSHCLAAEVEKEALI
jgi:hypothetical protein